MKVNDILVGTFQKIHSVPKNAPVAHCSRMLLEHFYLDAVYIIDTWIGTSINLSSDVEFTYSKLPSTNLRVILSMGLCGNCIHIVTCGMNNEY